MIPLIIFLIAWLILFGIYALLALVSVIQMARFAISGKTAYTVTAIFLAVAGFVILLTGVYIVSVDWSQGLEFSNILESPYI